MYQKRISHFKPFIVLGLVFLAWLALPVFVKSLLKASFYEFQAPLSIGSSYVHDLQDYWGARTKSKTELYEAAQSLARLNASYEISRLENQSLHAEIARLETLLQLPTRAEYRYEIARVAERDFTSWWQRITIRKGRDYDIKVGAPVVFVGGVVGRISEVHAYSAVVDLISNSHVRLAVVVEGDNRPFSYRGAGAQAFGIPKGLGEFIPMDIVIQDRKQLPRIVTSGMGGVFPSGIHVGHIASLRQGAGGMFNDADISLDKRLAALTEVAVMIQIPPAPPDESAAPQATRP